jgi:D-lactate dehydrogenase (cytochrome)
MTIPSALAGHVGDGNFHLIFGDRPAVDGRNCRGHASTRNGRPRAPNGGHRTGEHTGYGKMAFLAEHGEAAAVMRSIKRAPESSDILNPGKSFVPDLIMIDQLNKP